MSQSYFQTYTPVELQNAIEEDNEITLRYEVNPDYMGSFRGLFDALEDAPGEIEIQAAPNAGYTIEQIVFKHLSLKEVEEVLDEFSNNLFSHLENYNEDDDTVDVVLRYD